MDRQMAITISAEKNVAGLILECVWVCHGHATYCRLLRGTVLRNRGKCLGLRFECHEEEEPSPACISTWLLAESNIIKIH